MGSKLITVEEAHRMNDVPHWANYKCSSCGEQRPIDKKKSYEQQASCPMFGCDGQMMSGDWGGWYNRWRSLALRLLTDDELYYVDLPPETASAARER